MIPNMNKENRAELRTLMNARKKILRDHQQWNSKIMRESKRTTALHQRQIKAWMRQSDIATRRVNKELAKIERRQSILEGRLA